MRIIPVSVCHHVSTTGVRSPPMFSRYQTHASGLIGSPTVPSRRNDERSCLAAYSGPPLHVRTDRRGRRVKDVDAVALDDRPPAVLVGVVRDSLVDHPGRAVQSGPETMYECTVSEPMSAAHQYTVSFLTSKM